MGILQRMERRVASMTIEDPRNPLDNFFTLIDQGPRTATGKSVNESGARRYSPWFAAIRYSANHIATLPLKLHRRLEGGGKEAVRDHPTWELLHSRTNEEMSSADWRGTSHVHLLGRGNAYSWIDLTPQGEVSALWPLRPDRTELKRDDAGRPFYQTVIAGRRERLPFDRVLHISGLGGDGRTGWSIIRLARESIAMGLAMEEHGARFFGNAATPRGILRTPDSLSDDAKKRLAEQWQKAQGGLKKAHKVAVLEEGLEFQDIGFSAEDSQFLEGREFQVRDVARWTGIPPSKLAETSQATYSNVEQEDIAAAKDHLMPWARRWQQALGNQLLTPQERADGLFFEFEFKGLLQADTETRGQFYMDLKSAGAITPNEIRSLENMGPIDGGDTAFVQMQDVPLAMAGQMTPTERALFGALQSGDQESVKAVAEVRKLELASSSTRIMPLLEPPNEVREERQDGVQERLRLRDAFRPLLVDASGRLVRAEVQDLRADMGRLFAEEGPDGWIEFLRDFYARGGPFEGIARRTILPTFRSYAKAVAGLSMGRSEDRQLEPGDVDRFLTSEEGYFRRFVDRHAGESRLQLESLLEEDPEEADAGPRDLTEERLTEWREGTDAGRPRHEQMAERETVQLGEAIFKAGLIAVGVSLVRWDSGSTACPLCDALDGAIVEITSTFVEPGDKLEGTDGETEMTKSFGVGHPPAHRGCDCVLVAA